MSIKCSLIDIDNSGNKPRAIVTIGGEIRGKCSVVETGPIAHMNYKTMTMLAGGKLYDFSETTTR